MTLDEEGGREVPVPRRIRGSRFSAVESSVIVRLKNRVGTEPQVSGATNVAMADRPGWRNRSNLWTSLDVLPP